MAETNQATIKRVLVSSPPGQFDIIVEDLRSILPKASISSSLEPNFISAVRSEWESASGRSSLAAADGTGSDDGDGCITSISKAMDNYIALKFSSPGVRAAHTVTASTVDDTPTLTISTYAERIDLHNHLVGSMKGSYTICPSSGSLCGNISILAHAFENGGNVQLHSDISMEANNVGKSCSPSDDDEKQSSWAKAVTRKIESWEDNEVMERLSGMYNSMGSTYLKSLRRAMPITRTKMEWNVMAHRVVQTLGEGHDKEKFKH
ncbi:hypothetical protein ACHAXR_009867 [Thalassiosira sp. AJA248-18]